jgi:hypothetical protein
MPPSADTLLLIHGGIEGLNLHYVSAEMIRNVSAVAVMCVSFWLETEGLNGLITELRAGGVNVQSRWLRMLKFQVRRVGFPHHAKPVDLKKRLLCSVLDEAKREDDVDLLCACFGRGSKGHRTDYATVKDLEGPFLEHGSSFMYFFSTHSMEIFPDKGP